MEQGSGLKQIFLNHGSTQKSTEGNLLFQDETSAIRGTAFDVYKEMGGGFLEAVYQECLAKEFNKKEIPFVLQPELRLQYKGEWLKQIYRADFICYDKIILELKAVKNIVPEHKAQLINYLKATEFNLGLLINFGSYPKLQIQRFVL